mmetsp:Transcript_4232/g.8319  ORF Transcript_4232/g.8319 Transcript_4232/m.8319 type:complete len:244 (+) Transcript_4232:292-1023(+)
MPEPPTPQPPRGPACRAGTGKRQAAARRRRHRSACGLRRNSIPRKTLTSMRTWPVCGTCTTTSGRSGTPRSCSVACATTAPRRAPTTGTYFTGGCGSSTTWRIGRTTLIPTAPSTSSTPATRSSSTSPTSGARAARPFRPLRRALSARCAAQQRAVLPATSSFHRTRAHACITETSSPRPRPRCTAAAISAGASSSGALRGRTSAGCAGRGISRRLRGTIKTRCCCGEVIASMASPCRLRWIA